MKKIVLLIIPVIFTVMLAGTAFATSAAGQQSAESTSEATSSATSLSSAGTESGSTSPSTAGASTTTSAQPAESEITKLYFNAYLPNVPDETIDDVKALYSIGETSSDTVVLGTLWRCIREAGQLLGNEAEFSEDHTSFTVTATGIDFLDATPEVQQQVVDKITEGFESIGVATTYTSTTFSFNKEGTELLTYEVKADEPLPGASEDNSSNNVLIIGAIICAVLVAGTIIFIVVKKIKSK